MNLDKIIASSPQNATAAKVTSKGIHWEPAKKLIQPWDAWQDTPLPVQEKPSAISFTDLSGLWVDRLRVIGYAGRAKGSGGAKWVVRCACGMYGHQRTPFLKSEAARSRARCPKCDYLEEMKAGRAQLLR